jgi:phenylalanyl-tRNA synthetase beta chain
MIPEALAVTLALLPLFFESYHVVGYRSFNAVDETRKSFPFSLERLNHRLGSDYTEEEVNDVFKAYRIQRKGNLLTAPIDRVDLLEQCDIDEEVFRYYGYERIHPTLEHLPITLGKRTEEQEARFALQNLLIGRGFDEILTYTLLDEKADQSLRVFSHDPSYRILNPMTKDHEYVRSDLLPSLLETIRYNESHQHSDFRLFEISPIDTPKGNHLYLSLALIGNLSLTENFGSRPYTFLDLKGIVEALLAKLGLTPSRYRLEYSKNPAFHPGASADLYVGKTLAGTFGKLHPEVSKDEDLVGELDLGFLLSLKSSKTHFEPYSSFPTVRRDLSFRKKADVSYERLKRTIREVKNAYLLDVALFDDFKDPQTGEEYLGVSLTLGKEDGTLKDSEITAALGNVETAVKTQLGLTLRGE